MHKEILLLWVPASNSLARNCYPQPRPPCFQVRQRNGNHLRYSTMISEQLCLTAYRPCPRSWPQILYLPPAFTPILASQTVGMAVVVVGRQMSEVTWTKGGSARIQDSFPPAPLCLAHPIRPQKLFTDRASHRETQNCWELGEVRLTWRKCPGIDSWCQTAAVFAWCWAWAAQVGSRQVKEGQAKRWCGWASIVLSCY